MKKYVLDLLVVERQVLNREYVLLKLTNPAAALPEMMPGQFAELRVDGSKTTFLRRPISINFVDYERNEVWFLIRMIGDGTRALGQLKSGDKLNVLFPLGNSFTMSGAGFPKAEEKGTSLLLVGGGVGTAPLLYLGNELKQKGYAPVFLLGARTADDLLELDDFAQLGEVFTTTEDGSMGERGLVVQHSVLQNRNFSWIYSCGPKPMMQAVAAYAASRGIPCEVSLENKMACGVGACLCCVENTKEGHKCVCKEGPVFNTEDLLWQS